MNRITLLLVCISLVLASCVSGPEIVAANEFSVSPRVVTPMCQLGCLDTDPSPEEPGIYLTSPVVPDLCIDAGSQGDSDHDGISDFCEERIAEAFAPVLYYNSADDVSGEPRYALRPLGTGEVLILYMLSMYLDYGDGTCYTPPQFTSNPCAGHAGDSEVAELTVRYEPSSSHWVLTRAALSHHTSYTSYYASATGAGQYLTDLSYYSHPGAKPLIFVSKYKHALYSTDAECDAGGTLGADDCNSNAYHFVTASNSQNVGSWLYKFLDCVTSSNPALSSTLQECYWTGARFGGWQGFSPDAAGNSVRLLDFGF